MKSIEWDKLKKEQRVYVDKYNGSKSKDNKRRWYREIMKYEEKLERLKNKDGETL